MTNTEAEPRLRRRFTRPFADDDYTFELKWQTVSAYEKEHGISMMATLTAALAGRWLARDVREVIRLALIDGGTEPAKALTLVRTYVEDRPAAENAELFLEILGHFMYGIGNA